MTKILLLAFLLLHLTGPYFTIPSHPTTGKTRSQEEGLPPLLSPQRAQITTSYNAAKDQTTVRLAPAKISGDRAHYHSLNFSVFYSYPGKTKRIPEKLSLELLTVVKRRLLKVDLYVVFLVDGEEIFLPSSRAAIKNPVPGKRWVGERLEFHMPYQTFLKFARAKQLAVRWMDWFSISTGRTSSRFAILRRPSKNRNTK